MARTTLDLDPVVLRQLRERGKREGKTLGQAARLRVARRGACGGVPSQRQPPLDWISKPLGQPLVDLDDKDALYRILDEDHYQ